MKKIISVLLSLSMVSAIGGVPVLAGDKDDDITITLSWTNIPAAKQEVWKKYVFEPFQEKYPNVTIDFQCIPDQEQTTRVQLAAGAAADMFSMDCTDVFDYASSGFIISLEDYRKKYNLDDAMYSWAIKACEYNGELYALPHSVETSDMTYNMDLLKELGLEVPQTREEFENVCNKAIEQNIIPVAWGYSGVPVLVAWFYGHYLTTYAGPENVKKLLSGEITFEDENIKGAFEMMKADWDAGYINDKKSGAISNDEARSLFMNGKALFNMEGSWYPMADVEVGTWGFDWGQVKWPSMRDGVPAAGDISVGECIGINSNTEHADLCMELMLDFYLNRELAAAASAEGFSTPAAILSEEDYPEEMHEDSIKAISFEKEIMSAESVGYAPWGFFPSKMKVYLDDNLDKILYDQISIDEFLSQAQEKLDQDLADGYQFAG
ncbi:MAG: extracellular solute-binding protein [Eubacteriales bacterium]|nr:extracellular solute-binding protein [Eubacteriales bacterium]